MKNQFLQLFFCVVVFANINAQSNLTVDQSYTVEEMVMDFFNHPEITISNVDYTGVEASYGFFDSGEPDETALEVNAGIIISTGDAIDAIGPNQSSSTSTNMGGGSDPDLEALLSNGGPVNDAAVISFDLTVASTLELDFSYVFGSEEYCEFSGSNFNDIFGFFVSGPGIAGTFSNGGVNIATIPGSTNGDFVSINNINQNINTDLFIPNREDAFGNGCGAEIDMENMEYDGFSVALDASFMALEGETYHIRLALADVSDGIFDTGIFLGFNSLSTDSLLTPPAQFSASNTITNGAEFTNESKYATSYLWDFGNGTSSTEKNPGVVTYAAAGTYEVTLTTQNYCCTDVYTQMITVEEVGLSTSVSTSNNPLQCPGDSNASFDLSINGGSPPYTIDWEQGNVDPENLPAGFYQYTITDDGGQTLSGQFEIMSPDNFSGEVASTPDIDQQGNGNVEILLEGGTEPYTYSWSTGATTAIVNDLAA
ncbi:MAG: choice-of-anchor L domain-containing protein, partial [Saprospiraceae bacterium]